jgi:NAD(P)-dependent dehydrogenase (short-subunit alcohol dehydrogenase family)
MFAAHDNLDGVTGDDFIRLYRVNVVGAFQMIRACRALLEAGAQAGAVVNSASIAGVAGIGSSVPYAASKAALINMTLSLARALAPKIRVNAICPGFIDTPWFTKALPDAVITHVRAQVSATTPLLVASTADDIAGSAIFLGGGNSRHVTGETLLVDAGMHLTLTPVARE